MILAKGTPGLSGADLANLVNEAALLAARRDADKVHMEDFENAKDKVMMGTERRSMLISDEEKNLTAYHEAGHVLVAKFTPGSDPVHKVTIIPRGRALGVTHYLPIDEKHSWAKKYIENKMIHLMGGRAAEMLVFDDYTNGAAADIRQATEIARRMVCDWGMSEKIGPLALSNRDHEVFLGRDFATQRDYSDTTALEIDREIKRFVMNAQTTALDILKKNINYLHILAKALLEHEILDGEEIDLVLAGKKLPKPEEKKAREKKALQKTESQKKQAVPGGESGRLRQLEEVVSKLDESEVKTSTGRSGRSEQTAASKSGGSKKNASGTGRSPGRRSGGGSRGSGSAGSGK